MSRTRVKICGLTRVEDVKSAVAAGADAVGFVFTKSPRQINIETAMQLIQHVPGHVLRVGLFLDQGSPEICRVLEAVALDVLQFHGSETQQQCERYGLPWLKAVAMEDARSARQAEEDFPAAMGLLLDSHSRGQRGGSGKVFDWSLSQSLSIPVWLAGGLSVKNVGQAICTVRPYAVDVSSGVETAPGIKDPTLMCEFIRVVKSV